MLKFKFQSHIGAIRIQILILLRTRFLRHFNPTLVQLELEIQGESDEVYDLAFQSHIGAIRISGLTMFI